MKTWKRNFFQTHIMDIFSHISLNHIIKTVFPKLNFFAFLSSMFSINRGILCHKLRNAKIYPLEVQISDLFNISIKISPNYKTNLK